MSDLSYEPFDAGLVGFRCSPEWAAETESKLLTHLEALATGRELSHTGEPFCGCLTCLVREALVVTIPAVLDGVIDGLVERAT